MEARDWDRKWRDERPAPRTEPNRFLVTAVADLAPGRALDLACGAGRNAVWLAERGWQVTGVDFSEVALEKAQELARARGVEVEWVRADALDYEPEAGAFDLVVIAYLQLPAEERRPVWRRTAAALAPGGRLFVVAHHLDNLSDGWGGPKSPAVLFTPEEVAGELSGLEILRAERAVRVATDEEGAEHEAIDAVVLARRSPSPNV